MNMTLPCSATAQLESLYPSLPTSTRICIVGAGPSGLSAAYALVRLGYHNVTVLEQNSSVAGMCETVEIDGFAYDLGGQVVAKDSAPTIMALASEMRLEMVDMSNHKLALIDCKSKGFRDLDVAKDYVSIMPLTLRLQMQAEQTGKFGVHAIAQLAYENSSIFLKKPTLYKEDSCILERVPFSVSTGYTASGYGFMEDMPYAYVHEFTRTSMLGKIRRFKKGYATLWKSLAARLPEVQVNSQVVGIDRDSERGIITIQVAQKMPGQISKDTVKELEFDKVIISGTSVFKSMCGIYRSPPSPASSEYGQDHKLKMDLRAEEEDLFSKVTTIDYYTTVLKITGLDLPQGFYYCKEYVEDPSTIGHPVAMQRFHSATNVYLFWSYGSTAVTKKQILELLYEDVKAMGGKVEELLLQRKWDYFPHVSSQEMKAGFYDKLEELQGQNDTFYVGGLMAFELTERNAAYSINLMAKHFATSTESVKHAKKLFQLPLAVEENPYQIEDLSELDGVEQFPDLPSLDGYLQFWARHPVVGNHNLYTWLNDDGSESQKLTYAELDSCASTVARHLLKSIRQGERVILIHPPSLHFIIAFFACIRARILPVPLIPPDPSQRIGQALAKIEKVAAITEAKAILSTSTYHSAVNLGAFKMSFTKRRGSGPTWPDLPWIHTDSLIARNRIEIRGVLNRVFSKKEIVVPPREYISEKSRPPPSPNSLKKLLNKSPTRARESLGSMDSHDNDTSTLSNTDPASIRLEQGFKPPEPEDVCFLQFTSGSTGEAKGVIISHGGLIHNVKLMRSSYKSTSKTVLVSWLPQYHDMGLIGGLLTALVSGGTAILFSPMAFIRRPMLWLDTISKYRATHTAGPNFAFELVVRRYHKERSSGKQPCTLDLSSLRFMMISAEPIRSKTIKSFVEMLQNFGLREQVMAPGYGLAENCVFVSCAWGAQQPIMIDWQGRVCCGYVDRNREDMDIRIVSQETSEEVPEGAEGEVWVSSPSSGIGYWDQPQESTQTFKNLLKSSSIQKHYIKTGDLGRVIEGRLFITGRIKDLIIVRGQNVYPADIEKTVEDCCPLVRPGCCAVFGAPQETLESMGIPLAYSSDDVGVVVVAEVRDACIVDTEVLASIKAAIAEEHGLEVACISIIKPRSICKTSSGKIRRFECMRQFVNGKLQVVTDSFSQSCPNSPFSSTPTTCKHLVRKSLSFNSLASSFSKITFSPSSTSPMTNVSSPLLSPPRRMSREEIQSFLISLVADKVGMPPSTISLFNNITTYGLNAAAINWTAQKLSDFLGVNVTTDDIYNARSIFELSKVAVDLLNQKASMQVLHEEQQTASKKQEFYRSRPSERDIEKFLVDLIAEKTKIPQGKISVNEPLTSYGMNSVGVVHAAQKLSTFLGTQVAAIDIYTCSSISELVAFSKSLIPYAFTDDKEELSTKIGSSTVLKTPVNPVEELEMEIMADGDIKHSLHPSSARRTTITILQMMGTMYASAILLLPAVVLTYMVINLAKTSKLAWLPMAISLLPVAYITYIVAVGMLISLVAVPFLQPNYARDPCLLLWTVGFVKWWTLYRLQDFATETIACSLRGTIFMTWWYKALGAQVGKNVLLDTTDIVEPALLRIGKGTTIAEGACIQAHEVLPGLVRFRPVAVGCGAWMGPYSHTGMAAHIPAKGKISPLHVSNRDSSYKTEVQKTNLQSKDNLTASSFVACQQLLGLYLVSFVSGVSAVTAYPAFLWLCTTIIQLPNESLLVSVIDLKTVTLCLCMAATFPWYVAVLTPLVAYLDDLETFFKVIIELANHAKASSLAICLIGAYITYGVILCTITCTLKWCLIGKFKPKGDEIALTSSLGFRLWLVHHLITAAHTKFTMFLSGTEALCVYLRCMGSKVGLMASIRNINSLIDPDLLHLHKQCHLGDFAKVITSMPGESGGICSSHISIGAGSVVGAQSVVLPGARLESQVILGAMSMAAENSVLKEGGIYVGVQSTMIINQQPPPQQCNQYSSHNQNLEYSYKKLIASLAAHIASTTIKVQARYFHRVGVAGRGTMKVLSCLPEGFPHHDIFTPGKKFQVILRHSNSLSSDDDARGDARGAALRIIAPHHNDDIEDALLDLTLKSGKAFYARTLADFTSWLMGSREQRIESVKRAPHVGAAVWMSLRRPNSYAELHYYSNTCCILRACNDEQKEYYARFCLSPEDSLFNDDEGMVQADDTLPPDTGMLPRNSNDERPPLFLADDFRKRLLSPEGVRYVLQMQLQPVVNDPQKKNVALDCTLPWNEELYPFQDVALLHLNEVLDSQIAENLRFDPMNKTPSLDMIHATSQSDSASIDHGRCLAYVVAQHLRNGLPLRDDWKEMLCEVDMGKQILHQDKPYNLNQTGGCPALSGAAAQGNKLTKINVSSSMTNHIEGTCSGGDTPDHDKGMPKLIEEGHHASKEHLARAEEKESFEFIRLALIRGIQPLLQTTVPTVMLIIAIYPSALLLSYVGSRAGKKAMVALLPAAYLLFGLVMSILSILSRWVLIGHTKPGDTSELWGLKSLCDTTWQAIHALLCKCFLELTRGSLLCIMYFNCLGASISMEGVYMDTLHALNPDLLQIGPSCCIGRNALLFGHLYDGGRVVFKKIELGEGSCVGSRSLLLPGLKMEAGARLGALSLGMKDEVLASYE